jgi:hypothetical protein
VHGCQISKIPVWVFLELKMMVYVMAIKYVHYMAIWYITCITIWYILWSCGSFFPFWYVVPRTIWQPCPRDWRYRIIEFQSVLPSALYPPLLIYYVCRLAQFEFLIGADVYIHGNQQMNTFDIPPR